MMKLSLNRNKYLLFPILIVFLFVGGCQVTLAPAYDQALVEKVIENSDLAMQFFAEVEGGTDNSSYFARQATYNKLIGSFESLRIQARSRPMPDTKAVEKINSMLLAKGSGVVQESYPSAYAFERIAETFRRMKEFDREDDLNSEVISTLKDQVEIYLDQAITYESFLKR